MQKVVILDTRNQKDSFVQIALEKLGCTIIRSKLPFGDVALSTNILKCIDLKSSGGGLIELSKNICSSDHARVKREINKCLEVNGNISFMCFESGMESIEDIKNWNVPRFRSDLYKNGRLIHKKGDLMTRVKPETLQKAIQTMSKENHYKQGFKVDFYFATKENCGEKILKILGE